MGFPRRELASQTEVRRSQIYIPKCARHPHHRGMCPLFRVSLKVSNFLQNFGMQMPGWYDIVRPRDTVRLRPYCPIHDVEIILLTAL